MEGEKNASFYLKGDTEEKNTQKLWVSRKGQLKPLFGDGICVSTCYCNLIPLHRLLSGGANNSGHRPVFLIGFLRLKPKKQSQTINEAQLDSPGLTHCRHAPSTWKEEKP